MTAAVGGGPRDRRAFFDARAQAWRERGFSAEEARKLERLQARLGDLRGRTVFEPGCGAGRLTRLLATWVGPSGRVIAIDDSPNMVEAAREATLDAAREATRKARGAGAVEILRGDAESAALPVGPVDLALLFCVFPHLHDPAAALRRIRRMLAPDGRLVIAHLMGCAELNAMHREAGAAVMHDVLPVGEALTRMLHDAGFRVTEFVDEPGEFYLEAAAARG